jgi:mycolipanoate synthase
MSPRRRTRRELVGSMGVEHVYDSRAAAWFDGLLGTGLGWILCGTGAGKHQHMDFQALHLSGRGLESGKPDIFEYNGLSLQALHENISSWAPVDWQ